MDWFSGLRKLMNFWVFAGAAIIALGLLCGTVFILWGIRPDTAEPIPSTAVLYVIPYISPTPLPNTPTPQATQQGQDGSNLPSPPPGDISKNVSVQISGTGGDGLRLRTEPGLNSEVKYLGLEGEIFQVEDGPQMVDGYTWWFLVAPYDTAVRGWAVSNFLKIVQSP
jgi:hypothetical protein